MSGIYHTEPPTQGKVLLKTTHGDIDIELWPKETPLACRNFVQLCLEGYYDGLLVHRVIKDFMIQTGDPNGDGSGGTSLWGRPFKDEIHGRIKFNHRGQVAMANENKPNTNQSQFFITLGACDWIDRKHTIFGKVTGNTIYNVTRMGDVEVGLNDKPVDPIKIIKAEVLWNPFDDIIPRVSVMKKDNISRTSELTDKDKSKKSKNGKSVGERKAVKDSKLLSFGDDDEGEEERSLPTKSVTAAISKTQKQPVQSSSSGSSSYGTKNAATSSSSPTHIAEVRNDDDDNDGETDFEKRMLQSISQKRKIHESSSSSGNQSKATRSSRHDSDDDEDEDDEQRKNTTNKDHTTNKNTTLITANITTMSSLLDDDEQQSSSAKVTEKALKYQQLRQDLLRSKRSISVLTGADVIHLEKESLQKEVISVVEQRRQKYMKRKNDYGNRQEDTIAKLLQFTNNIRQEKQQLQLQEKVIKANNTTKQQDNDDDDDDDKNDDIIVDKEVGNEPLESYHGQILRNDDNDNNITGDEKSWHVGKLKCKKHIDDKYRIGSGTSSDGRNVDDYEVIDARSSGNSSYTNREYNKSKSRV